MDRYEKAALLDFVASVVWPTRTVRLVSDPSGEDTFTVNAPAGGWVTATDLAMAWVNGQRVTGAITWVDGYNVTLPSVVPLGRQVVIFVSPGAGSGYLPRNGLAEMLGSLDMDNFQILNLGASTESHHAVRRDEVMAIVSALLGGNYVLKAGDQMDGALLGADAGILTDAAALVRRDMVALLDGTQAFTGKVAGVSTIDTDPGVTLTTKDWVIAYVQAQLAASQAPNSEDVFDTAASGLTWTVPAGVRKIWMWVKGGQGGDGGDNGYATANDGGTGGLGGIIAASLPVVPGAVLNITVGGKGGNGQSTAHHDQKPGGGGGGGASQVGVGTDEITAGGGGGGGAGGVRAAYAGANGGAGGVAGGNGGWSGTGFGGLPGNTIETAGGVGGIGGYNYSDGGNGTQGNAASTSSFNTSDTFPFQSVTDPNAANGIGTVIIKWYEE